MCISTCCNWYESMTNDGKHICIITKLFHPLSWNGLWFINYLYKSFTSILICDLKQPVSFPTGLTCSLLVLTMCVFTYVSYIFSSSWVLMRTPRLNWRPWPQGGHTCSKCVLGSCLVWANAVTGVCPWRSQYQEKDCRKFHWLPFFVYPFPVKLALK